MIPAELVPRRIRLPPKDGCRIVVFTGASLRHDRFALRVQSCFGERVVGWFQVVPTPRRAEARPGTWERLRSKARTVVANPRLLAQIPGRIRRRLAAKGGRRRPSRAEIEQKLFGAEVRSLWRGAHLKPVRVTDPNATAVVQQVQELDPYLILTLGGAIYKQELLRAARGLALNQHDGWCPEYKGTSTVDWALYHRDVPRIGNTIHVLTSGMDAGPIVRRSTACIVDDDDRGSCFARVVALGTELMCEVVEEIIDADELTVYDQPAGQGATYLAAHRTERILEAIDRDLENGLLAQELARLRRF